MKKMSKLLAALLAVALVFSMSLIAFADEEADYADETTDIVAIGDELDDEGGEADAVATGETDDEDDEGDDEEERDTIPEVDNPDTGFDNTLLMLSAGLVILTLAVIVIVNQRIKKASR